jgi:uncharacterized protein YbjT (DUF2867 family)
MADKKIVTIMGATGYQGGGLARAILAENGGGELIVRAVTRDVNSEKAKELARRGAQVVAGDLDDPPSVKRAFAGAWGVFCVTFYWAHMSPEKELTHARLMAESARDARVQHAVWSTLEDSRKFIPPGDERMPTLMGKYKVPHFDAKGEADRFFTDSGVPTTFLLASYYWDNFILFGMGPKRGPDGTWVLSLPMEDKPLGGISGDDVGPCALGIFKQSPQWVGKTVGIAGEHLTGEQMAERLSKVLGEPVTYNPVPFETFRKLGFPGAEDLGNMFQFYSEFSDYFATSRSVEVARRLNPKLKNFDAWLARNKDALRTG